MSRLWYLVTFLFAVGAAAPAFAYDASWYKATGWSGEYPNGFTMATDVSINIRASLNLDAPKSVPCLLREGATYHQWNKKRVASDRLEFVSFTKIVSHELNADFTAQVLRKSDDRKALIKFRKGDRYSYLAYLAEGSFLIKFGDTVYVADQDLAEKSTEVGTPNKSEQYDEWLKLKCANGPVGWIFVGEIKNTPGLSEPNIIEYGIAKDRARSKPIRQETPILHRKDELVQRLIQTVPEIKAGRFVQMSIPAVPCPGGGQIETPPPDLPASVRARIPASLEGKVAYYKSPWDKGLLGPIGWTCYEHAGSGGGSFIIAPPGTNFQSVDKYRGPIIVRRTNFGGTSGRFDVARISASVFSLVSDFVYRIKSEAADNSELIFSPWPGDTLYYLSPAALAFRTAPNAEGLGTLGTAQSEMPVDGIAFLSGKMDEPDLTVLAVRLPPNDISLYSAIVIYALSQ